MNKTTKFSLADKVRRALAALTAAVLASTLVISCMPRTFRANADTAAAAEQEDDTLDIAVLSDIHVLPSELIADTDDYQDALYSDRKLFTESQGILDRMLEEVKERAPDVLMISGDLTKDGELESHEYVASKLEELKEALPDLKIYVTNGNHDINNSLAYNYNTDDGTKDAATRTTPELFLETYADSVYNEENGVVAQFTPSTYSEEADGDKAGMLSYVAEPAEGYTIIVVDSGRYSADNTDDGTAEHQTSGQISDELKEWVIEQAEAAAAKGNVVIGMMHHGLVEHFDMEEELLSDYLVNDYEVISEAFADAGIHYVFTGHMHANDISTMTTEAGNELYDIETGSAVTYPCPMRFVSFTRTEEDQNITVSAEIETVKNLDGITYLTADKQEAVIDDLTEYAKQPQFGLSENVIVNVGTEVVDELLNTVQEQGVGTLLESLISSLTGFDLSLNQAIDMLITLYIPEMSEAEEDAAVYLDENGDIFVNLLGGLTISKSGLKSTLNYFVSELDRIIAERTVLDDAIEQAIKDILAITVYEDDSRTVTLIQLVNDVYQTHLSGDDNGNRPAYIAQVIESLNSGELFVELVGGIVDALYGAVVAVSGDIGLGQFLGTAGFTYDGSAFIPRAIEGRTPLITINADGTAPALTMIIMFVMSDLLDGNLGIAETATVQTVLDRVGQLGSLLGSDIDIPEMLTELLIGTPATEETPAEEGLIDAELQNTLTDFLVGVIDSMSEDTNYPEDGNTAITVTYPATDSDEGVTSPDDGNTGDDTSGGDTGDVTPDSGNGGVVGFDGDNSSVNTGLIAGLCVGAVVIVAAIAVVVILRKRSNKKA